ncbi:MAG TPA: hypothetical protein VF263_12235 [Longimicrobiaceae bacterium]
MLNIRPSAAEQTSEVFEESPRQGREGNLAWIERNLSGDDECVTLLLVGGVDPCHFRLRVSQSHLRRDMTPSHWSHAALLGVSAGGIGATPVHEIALDPPGGFGYPAPVNGVQTGRLDHYRERRLFPNLALVRVPVALAEVEGALERFRSQRVVLDGPELILVWLAYLWGVGRSGNPLLEGNGIPSAAMLEVVMGAAGIDLTPGLESRASCPEAIWQAARWWHSYYDASQRSPLGGRWTAEHFLVGEYDPSRRR